MPKYDIASADDVRTACGCDDLDFRGVSNFIWLAHISGRTIRTSGQITKPMFNVSDFIKRNPKMTYTPGPVLDSDTGMLQPVIVFQFAAVHKTFSFEHGNLAV